MLVSLARWIGFLTMFAAVVGAVLLSAGFFWFMMHIPTEEVQLDRKADGIVVLTGAAARIPDAIELLAAEHGQRLLITGVYRATSKKEIARLTPLYAKYLSCCIDLDRSALNTFGNAIETRRWAHRAQFQFADHRDIELAHAARHDRNRPPASGLDPHPLSGDFRADEEPGLVAQWRNGAAVGRRISEISVRAGALPPRSRYGDVKEPVPVLNLLRSIAFNVLFYLNTAVWLIIGAADLPHALRRPFSTVAKAWGRVNLLLLRVVAGITYEIRGREKLPRGPLIIAAKHQSAWEIFALLPLFRSPTFIMKRELQWVPIFGWYTIKGRMVPVDRGAGVQALNA